MIPGEENTETLITIHVGRFKLVYRQKSQPAHGEGENWWLEEDAGEGMGMRDEDVERMLSRHFDEHF